MPFPRSFLPFVGVLLILTATTAHAQQPAATVLPSPNLPTVPGTLPTVPGALPIAPGTQPVGPAPVERADTRLLFPNAPIADILNDYETLSGKHVLYDQSVQGQITLNVPNFVTRTEAMHIIEAALNLNGFALIASQDNVVKVIGLGKPVRPAGVPIFWDLSDVPDNEQVVTFVVRLRYLDPQETAGMLTQYIPPGSSIAFTALEKAGALLITDTARSVRRLLGLINLIDLPASPVTERFVRLQRADATKAVEFLNSVFETKNAGTTPGASNAGAALPGNPTVRRPIRRVGEDGNVADINPTNLGGNGSPTLSGDSLILGRITLNADVRTNRVHIVTSPLNMPLVERLLSEYDSDIAFATPVRFPLKFLRPDLLLPILVQSLQEGPDDKNGTTPGATNPNKNGVSNANNNNNNNSALNSLNGGGGLGGGGLSSLSSTFGTPGSGSTQEIDTTPQEVTVGNNRLIADISTSSIVLLGGKDAEDKVRAIISQLDRRSPQVLIHTVIGELSLGNNRELGFQYLLRTKQLGLTNNANLFTSTTASATPAATASTGTTGTTGTTSALSTLSSLASGLGTSFSGVGGVLAVGRSLDIILAALESTTRFKTISRPMIVTSNFKKASITSGQTISVSTGSVGSLATTASTTGIYQQTTQELAALQLSVTPQINSDKEVVMEVDQQLNSPLGTSSTVNGSANQQLSVRQLHNYVSARNGETIVLGGLITLDDNISDSNIPYLSRIPVVGTLFKSRTRDATRSELIILMQPEVVDTAGIMAGLREREENKTYLGHELDHQLDPIEVRKAIPVKRATPVRTTTVTTTSTSSTGK